MAGATVRPRPPLGGPHAGRLGETAGEEDTAFIRWWRSSKVKDLHLEGVRLLDQGHSEGLPAALVCRARLTVARVCLRTGRGDEAPAEAAAALELVSPQRNSSEHHMAGDFHAYALNVLGRHAESAAAREALGEAAHSHGGGYNVRTRKACSEHCAFSARARPSRFSRCRQCRMYRGNPYGFSRVSAVQARVQGPGGRLPGGRFGCLGMPSRLRWAKLVVPPP